MLWSLRGKFALINFEVDIQNSEFRTREDMFEKKRSKNDLDLAYVLQ